eukprot:PhF_6_TR4874/c0_g1_i2/m.6858
MSSSDHVRSQALAHLQQLKPPPPRGQLTKYAAQDTLFIAFVERHITRSIRKERILMITRQYLYEIARDGGVMDVVPIPSWKDYFHNDNWFLLKTTTGEDYLWKLDLSHAYNMPEMNMGALLEAIKLLSLAWLGKEIPGSREDESLNNGTTLGNIPVVESEFDKLNAKERTELLVQKCLKSPLTLPPSPEELKKAEECKKLKQQLNNIDTQIATARFEVSRLQDEIERERKNVVSLQRAQLATELPLALGMNKSYHSTLRVSEIYGYIVQDQEKLKAELLHYKQIVDKLPLADNPSSPKRTREDLSQLHSALE